MTDRAALINGLIGTPYRLGGQGPGEVDCWSAARILQKGLADRDMPAFEMPSTAGRIAIASAIAVHPERNRWVEIASPVDVCLVTMAHQHVGYHIGTWVVEDGGLIIHAIEKCGVVADRLIELQAMGWRRVRFHVPAENSVRAIVVEAVKTALAAGEMDVALRA